jgi:hypothetical protein
MAAAKFLDYEVALLLAKHGKTAVLNALSRKLQLTPEQLEAILQTPLNDKLPSRSKKNPFALDLVAQLAQEHPNKAHLLKTLHDRFGNKTFLPELRDVKRFLEQHDRSPQSSKSRAETLPTVLRLLAVLDITELEDLCRANPENGYSSLGVISDEILGRGSSGSNKDES